MYARYEMFGGCRWSFSWLGKKVKDRQNSFFGNRLLNWPKLLRLYADGFYSIFVPECVPYIIPHMFQ